MGCSSCQQNNHVVPTTYVNNLTTQSHCECACGCDEPVCPTPQPCTEITDSKCIIYTDSEIKCGNDTIVTTNASVSTALNQVVAYFCGQIGLVTTVDILCGNEVIVPANTNMQDALDLVVQFICNIQLTPGPQGVQGPAGPQGNAGTNGTNAYKFVYEKDSVFDGDYIEITRSQLETCGLIPPSCFSNDGLVDEVCDLHFQLYYLESGNWNKIPNLPIGSADQGYNLKIDDATGLISIELNIAPVAVPVRVRVVILA